MQHLRDPVRTAQSIFNQRGGQGTGPATATDHGVWTNNDNTGTLDNFRVWQLDPVLPELTHTGGMSS